MEAWGEFGSLRKLHDEFFSILEVHLELARSQPHVRRAVLQLFVVDSEVVRNLAELLTGENPEPEVLSREFPEQWFQRGRERIDHWDWSEILTRTRAIANDLLILLSKPLPRGLRYDDHGVQELTKMSIAAVKDALTCVGPLGTGDQNAPDSTP